jgi:hypothetical protein
VPKRRGNLMNGKKGEATRKPGSEEIVYPDQLPTYYSNVVRFYISNSDFVFDFAAKDPRSAGETIEEKTKVQVRVVMSPQHAKVFANLLVENMKQYEKTFGVLNTEPIKS